MSKTAKYLYAKIREMDEKIAGHAWKPLEEFGCFVKVDGDSIMSVPMLANGKRDSDDQISEVTAPESQKFLDAVNKAFQTSFRMSQFSGR